MTHTKAIAATLIVLAGGTWSGPTLAQATPDPIVVEVNERLVTGQVESVHVDQPLDAGTYTMTIQTSDGYEGRAALSDAARARQTSERVTVLGHTTRDLDDTAETVSDVVVVTVELTEGVDHFTIDHAGTGTDWDSVNVDTITFTPRPDAPVSDTEPEPTPEPTPTTQPLVEHPAPTIPEPAPAPEQPTTTAPKPVPAPRPELPEAQPAVPTPAQPKYTG